MVCDMSHSMTLVTCQHEMSDPVDMLKEVLGVETDLALAEELGLERSTVSQWRRRRSLPRDYQAILDAHAANEARAHVLASRQRLYGDARVMYQIRAALAVIPADELTIDGLAPALIGDHREQLIANIAPVVRTACVELFDRPTCETEEEYLALVELLTSPPFSESLRRALIQPTLGWHL